MPRLRRGKLLFLIFAGAISLMLLVVSGYQLYDFTDSTAFCGRICHQVMYPEYTAFQASPHSRVRCSECHVGPGADYLVKSKISGIPQIFYTLTGTYPRPLETPVENLRPARETCEQCHRPEEFSGDLVRYKYTYKTDEFNTERIDTRVLRVGGGKLERLSEFTGTLRLTSGICLWMRNGRRLAGWVLRVLLVVSWSILTPRGQLT